MTMESLIGWTLGAVESNGKSITLTFTKPRCYRRKITVEASYQLEPLDILENMIYVMTDGEWTDERDFKLGDIKHVKERTHTD
jgi:hypothetical protein